MDIENLELTSELQDARDEEIAALEARLAVLERKYQIATCRMAVICSTLEQHGILDGDNFTARVDILLAMPIPGDENHEPNEPGPGGQAGPAD